MQRRVAIRADKSEVFKSRGRSGNELMQRQDVVTLDEIGAYAAIELPKVQSIHFMVGGRCRDRNHALFRATSP